ncbi:response regulator transcription factor [Alsobacter sp. KACC 23698]|uniref:Response regulator transcription factor n=1 Tax=Alsobacter sp. KACC 23698 TaxID=3149229 RepID=A0AAU7JJR7_9HYPH
MGVTTPAIVVDKSALLRDGLVGILKQTSIKVIAAGATLDDCRSADGKAKPKLVLGSLSASDDLAEWIGAVRAEYPDAKVAILSDRADPDRVGMALRLGVDAFVLSSLSSEAFIGALELCLLGVSVLPCGLFSVPIGAEAPDKPAMRGLPAPPKLIATNPAFVEDGPRLSSREVSILRLLIEGRSNKLIARELDIAEATVKVHVKAVLRKIRVQNRTQAAIWAMSNGIVSSDADLLVNVIPAITGQSGSPIHA